MNGRLLEEIREEIDIRLRAEEDPALIALRTGASVSQVYRLQRNLTVFGNIEAPRRPWGQARKILTPEEEEVCIMYNSVLCILKLYILINKQDLLEFVYENPDLYLDEAQRWIYQVWNKKISTPTLSRTLRRAGLTRKKLTKKAAQCNSELRANYRYRMA
jgi:transposase